MRVQANGLVSREIVSDVEDFAKGLIKGAAVKGSERVSDLLSGWLQGKPVEYRASAILNGPPVEAPLAPLEGIHIEPLPLSTDELPASLPRFAQIRAEDYLGRTMVSIDSTASPALFHPQTNPLEPRVQAKLKVGMNFDTVCQALSLESDSYVDAAFYWNDYRELVAFFLFDGTQGMWSSGKASLKSRPTPYTLRPETTSEGSTIRLEGHPRMCLRSETQLARTLEALKTLQASDKTRIAVSRWVKSKDSGEQLEDRFIDLRIALECLYLQNFLNEKQTQEMRFRLSLFGAWHLGTDFKERKRIRKKLLKAYDSASKAVHSGTLEFTDENQQQLSSVQDLCRRGIFKLLEEGPPHDWGDLILGADHEEQTV